MSRPERDSLRWRVRLGASLIACAAIAGIAALHFAGCSSRETETSRPKTPRAEAVPTAEPVESARPEAPATEEAAELPGAETSAAEAGAPPQPEAAGPEALPVAATEESPATDDDASAESMLAILTEAEILNETSARAKAPDADVPPVSPEEALRETLLVAGAAGHAPGPSPEASVEGAVRDADFAAKTRAILNESAATRGADARPEEPAAATAAPQESPPAPPPAPRAAAKPESPPAPEAAAAPPAAPPAAKPRPTGLITIKELRHKTSEEFMSFVQQAFPDWIANGNVSRVEGKGRSVVIVGEKPDPADPLTQMVLQIADDFDDLELKVEGRKIRPRYVDVVKVLDALTMRGIANVWKVTETTNVATWKVGDKNVSAQSKNVVYAQTGLVPGSVAPIPVPPRIPYVYEIPSSDPFEIPKTYGGPNAINQPLVDFRLQSSTEERGAIMAVGTYEDIEEIQAFIDTVDVPARQVLIEVEVVELDASKLTDLGIDSVQFGERHTLVNTALPLPGQPIIQPGFGDGARRNPEAFVPDITQQGLSLLFDDTSVDLTGRFIITVHALVREGDAKVTARPKILTLDDRESVLHIGRNVPVFESTAVTNDATVGNYVSEVNKVTNYYVGFTLNIRPHISGGAEDEVSLQLEVVMDQLGPRQQVFAEDLLGIPDVIKRKYVGQNRVKNHRPIVLGGLIAEEASESASKIPILGDIPYLGYLFGRRVTQKSRQEVILILTPHILSDKGWDRFAAPKESATFDTYDSVLFNDTHIIKGKDVIGIDPISGSPQRRPDGTLFTEEQVVDLTLINIARERELVSKLRILDDYLGDAAKELNWIQKKWPEATVHNWPDKQKELYFRAVAILIENIKELNPDLTFEEIVIPRREIILPTTPYRINLSYDRVKALQRDYAPFLRDNPKLSELTVNLLRDASGRSLREFADFLEDRKCRAEKHGSILLELKKMYVGQEPMSKALEGIQYPDVYRELARSRFDFVALATFFREEVAATSLGGEDIRVGEFEKDLKDFLESSVTLHQRARRLMELEQQWEAALTVAEVPATPADSREARSE